MTGWVRILPLVIVGLLFWAPSARAAATGQVLDKAGAPVVGAEACIFHPTTGAVIECVKTDTAGYYRLEKPTKTKLLIRAKGFVPAQVAAIEQSAPVVLAPAAILLVKVIDASNGHPIPSGRVILNYASGKRVGDSVPFNKDGVLITTLEPGDILARCEAIGFEPGGPEPVALEGGVKKTVTIAMRRSPSGAH